MIIQRQITIHTMADQ